MSNMASDDSRKNVSHLLFGPKMAINFSWTVPKGFCSICKLVDEYLRHIYVSRFALYFFTPLGVFRQICYQSQWPGSCCCSSEVEFWRFRPFPLCLRLLGKQALCPITRGFIDTTDNITLQYIVLKSGLLPMSLYHPTLKQKTIFRMVKFWLRNPKLFVNIAWSVFATLLKTRMKLILHSDW